MNHVHLLKHFISEDGAEFFDYPDSPGLWAFIDKTYSVTPVFAEYDKLVFYHVDSGKVIPTAKAHGLKWIKISDYVMPSSLPGWSWRYSYGWESRCNSPHTYVWDKYRTKVKFFADIRVSPGNLIAKEDDVPELVGFLQMGGCFPGRSYLIDGKSPYYSDRNHNFTEIFKTDSGDLQELQAQMSHRLTYLEPPEGFSILREGDTYLEYFYRNDGPKEYVFEGNKPDRGYTYSSSVNGEVVHEEFINAFGFTETGEETPPVWTHIPTELNP